MVLFKLPNSFQQIKIQMKHFVITPKQNILNRRNIFITVSIMAIGLSWFIYYIQIVYNKNKRIMNKTSQLIDMIPELKNTKVKIKNPNHVEYLLSNMINMGKEKLQVVSDFDRTITPVICPTSNGLLEMSRFVSVDLKREFQKLRNYYWPIEHNPKMPKEQKIPFMIEWWTKSLDLTIKTKVSHDAIEEIVKSAATHLREGCKWFFYTLERHEVPLLVFSAGLGDIIQEWIAKEAGNFKNLKIVSNFMTFDNKTNQITGFNGKLIHVFNKNEGALLETAYEKKVINRPNVILLGDSLGDIDMTVGLTSIENVLKIGFLNDKVDEFLPAYMDSYDIVIIKDNTFEIPNAILRSVL